MATGRSLCFTCSPWMLTLSVVLLAFSTPTSISANERLRRSNLMLTTTTTDTPTTITFPSSPATPIGTMTDAQLTLNAVDSFFGMAAGGKKASPSDPVSSIFVASNDDAGDEAMARYFFFNSNVGTYNTSVSFTIPLFSFSMPDFSGSLLNDLGVQTLFTLAAVGILFFGGLALLPYIFAYYGAGTLLPFFGGRSLDGGGDGDGGFLPAWVSQSLPSFDKYLVDGATASKAVAAVEAAVAKFAAAVGDQCAKRAVCEAHTDAQDGNPFSMPLRAVFPVPDLETGGYLEDIRLTPWQVASLYGRSRDADCGDQYRMCFASLLDATAAASRLLATAHKYTVALKN